MATEKEYAGKVIPYGGGEEKWREWSIKTNAYANTRGWEKALTQNCELTEVLGADLTSEQEKDRELNLKAWNHLVMACQESAFTVLTTATMSNAHEGWNALLQE